MTRITKIDTNSHSQKKSENESLLQEAIERIESGSEFKALIFDFHRFPFEQCHCLLVKEARTNGLNAHVTTTNEYIRVHIYKIEK